MSIHSILQPFFYFTVLVCVQANRVFALAHYCVLTQHSAYLASHKQLNEAFSIVYRIAAYGRCSVCGLSCWVS